ncbi:MAG: orotidine-5'-phosphate decarboxylase [Lachnospiraceae bacterium]|nr:orotidine-5'-phosphate decarboxylase [Lachnospiraceae bacterium]
MISILIEKIKKTNAPICVGLDPMLDYLPSHLLNKAIEEEGEVNLKAVANAVLDYNKAIIDATCDLIPSVKPQIAMYEQFGIPGLKAFKKTVAYAQKKGLVVIGDIKRGDIGSTSAAYATGHIGKITVNGTTLSTFNEDIVTVNPYLGTDGVKPFIDTCNEFNKGIFVLVKTSNKSSGEFQDKVLTETGKPLYETVGAMVNEWAEMSMDGEYSNVGAVVGATYPEMGEVLRKIMPKSYILVPGYGAQGGKGSDLKPFFNADGLGAIVNSSRGIIAAYKQEKYAKYGEKNFAEAAREAVIAMQKDIIEGAGL